MGISQKDIDDYVGQIKKWDYDKEDCEWMITTKHFYLLPYNSLMRIGEQLVWINVIGVTRYNIPTEDLTEFKEFYSTKVIEEVVRSLELESKSSEKDMVKQYYDVLDKYIRVCQLTHICEGGFGNKANKELLKEDLEEFNQLTYTEAEKRKLTVSDTLRREFERTRVRFDI